MGRDDHVELRFSFGIFDVSDDLISVMQAERAELPPAVIDLSALRARACRARPWRLPSGDPVTSATRTRVDTAYQRLREH
jgi:hypothetical protein